MVSSWSAWASGVSVGLPHIESTGSFNARPGAGQVAGRYGGSTPAHSAVAASAGACRPLANGLAICPEDVPRMKAGEEVDVQMLDWPEAGLLPAPI